MKTNMTATEILAKATTVTVVNDGQVRYPVLTCALEDWTRRNGPITSATYETFCSDVECIGEKSVGTPGSEAMTGLCDALEAAGCDVCRPA